jgi:hypothetical protein
LAQNVFILMLSVYGERISAHTILAKKPECKRQLGITTLGCEENIGRVFMKQGVSRSIWLKIWYSGGFL